MAYKTTAYLAVSDMSIRWTVDDLLRSRSDYSLVGACGENSDVAREIQILAPDVIFTDGTMGGTDAFILSYNMKLYMAPAAPLFVLFFRRTTQRSLTRRRGRLDYEIGYPSRQIYYSDLLDSVHRDCRRRKDIREGSVRYGGGPSGSPVRGSDIFIVSEEGSAFSRDSGVNSGKAGGHLDAAEVQRRRDMVNCLLDDLGVKRSLTGYGLLSDAVLECVKYPGSADKSMKDIYILLESIHGMGNQNLERNIRTALGYMWKCGSRPALMEVMCERSITPYNCPSNSSAIHHMAHYLIWKNCLY